MLALVLLTAALNGEPVASLQELGRALHACFRPPPHSAGSQMTVRFNLTRDGAVQGKPAITYAKLQGSAEHQRAFVAAVLASLAACTPVALSPSFAGAIAGRPFTLRFFGAGGAGPNRDSKI